MAVATKQALDMLLDTFRQTRAMTLEIVRNLKVDDYMVQTAPYTSPPKWHIGHVSWLHEVVMSKISPRYRFYSDHFSSYLNSYYQHLGKPHDKSKRGTVSRPTLDEILQYFHETSRRVDEFIRNESLEDEHIQLITMGVHHEYQHQELMVYDLQHMLGSSYKPAMVEPAPPPAVSNHDPVRVGSGLYQLGYGGDGYCYDIELPEHKVYLESYEIGAFPVTNEEYIRFIDDGGYDAPRYWLADGWESVRENGWQAPMYWKKEDGAWVAEDFAGRKRIDPNKPVCHVSFYEADAYCRWAGKRLPTEAEWEKAACWDEEAGRKRVFPWGNEPAGPDRANLLESRIWRCSQAGSYPRGVSPSGCYQMIGDVWEWTSSEFVGYPGFKTGFEEYNDKWFANQKVLRGGSFATPAASIRGSYRNFFRLDERWLLSGFRCASDV